MLPAAAANRGGFGDDVAGARQNQRQVNSTVGLPK